MQTVTIHPLLQPREFGRRQLRTDTLAVRQRIGTYRARLATLDKRNVKQAVIAKVLEDAIRRDSALLAKAADVPPRFFLHRVMAH